jgi:glycosyltransferase involved in cell wall biosynthesis
MINKSVSIIICAFNEEITIGHVLKKLRDIDFVTEIIAVDNGSIDKTFEILGESSKLDSRLKVFQIKKNIGLGYGLKHAINQTKCDIVVRQDADLEYDPFEIINLVEQIDNGNANVVYGSRILVRKAHKVHYFYNYIANKLLTFLNNLVTNLFLSDVETASKAFDGDIIRSVNIRSKGFEIENELTIKLKKINCTFYEVPISYYGRSFKEGKKIRVIDGFKAVYFIFYYTIVVFLFPSSCKKK